MQPDALLVNSFNGTPRLAPDRYRLVVNGAVRRPLRLDLAALAALPQRECVIRHVCVEGWAAIVAWSGPRLADVLALAGPSPLGAYLAIRSADQYFETCDLASALHPQTLLATHMNGAPLPVANGAPREAGEPHQARLQAEQVGHRPRADDDPRRPSRHLGGQGLRVVRRALNPGLARVSVLRA